MWPRVPVTVRPLHGLHQRERVLLAPPPHQLVPLPRLTQLVPPTPSLEQVVTPLLKRDSDVRQFQRVPPPRPRVHWLPQRRELEDRR